nr:retrovirus-related Pol polyprotein from transposon TNT 1-94 [Tanacetum cinerariifolium]
RLVRSRDVEFEEDQTLKDVEKAKKEIISQHNDDPIDLDPVPPKHLDSQFEDGIQNDEEQGTDDVDAQEQPNLDEDTEELTSRPRYKARLVVKGFSQKRGIDFNEIFSSVVKMGSIRVVLGLAASLDLKRFGDDDFIILLLYVDDMLIVSKNIERIAQLKRDLSKSFAMKDLGPAKQILGIRIFRDRGAKKLHISQEQYIEKVLRRFNMDKAKVVSSPLTSNFKLTDKDCLSYKKNIEKMNRVPYASAIGSLMYAMVCTRPDLAHAVGVVSRFLSNPGKKHWEAVKWIFRYLRGTSKLGITFGNGKPTLVGYTDSDLAGNKDNMKSTSGYLMTFAGGAVSWQSRLQKCVALSTTEAEYVAAVTPPKMRVAAEYCTGALLHNTTAPVIEERPLNVVCKNNLVDFLEIYNMFVPILHHGEKL